ncbi:MAG: TraM recognition domain-containing protein [Candidatus Pacebacteria bacterium]|nr:TraM recognition domain-containing protein [Candidatus Paceibacterota bacterium]MBP9780662.1 TraM recognition domain-containing protein [Candidatus Paceibacterota bacterium]
MEGYLKEVPQFNTPEEELAYLREHVSRREKELYENGFEAEKAKIAHETLRSYGNIPKAQALERSQMIQDGEAHEIVLRLKPEPHDHKMEELLGILLERGIRNVLDIIEKSKNPHLDDDFHRFLVQYLISSDQIPGLKEGTEIWKSLHMKLFEVTLPEKSGNDTRGFKDFLGGMEQFFAGMNSIASDKDNTKKNYFTIEVALSNQSDEVVVYVGVPNEKIDLFEKQLNASFPNSKIREVVDDYNVFMEGGGSAGSYAVLEESEIYPLKTFDTFDHDPINALLNAFSKLKKEGEGASVQFVIAPTGTTHIKRFQDVLKHVEKGLSAKDALKKTSSAIDDALIEIGKGLFFGHTSNKDEKEPPKIDDRTIKRITEKMKATMVLSNIRIISGARDVVRAEQIVAEIASSFNQFTEAGSNSLVWKKVEGNSAKELFHMFSYRIFDDSKKLVLNLHELSTMIHFPYGITSAPQLKQARAGTASAPLELIGEGTLLGVNRFRGFETPAYLTKEDRVRHFYCIGQTGTGKTTLLKNMIVQDIEAGHGVCYIDPHGNDIQDILASIPRERIDDVIYFDPAYTARPMGLNMLEYDPRFPEQKSFVVDEMLSIFNKLFDMKTAGGPMFEQYFRNATMLVLEDPESGNTLLDISRVLADEKFRALKLSKCTNPVILQFWNNIAGKAGGEASLQNIVPYIVSKFDVFLSNEIMRPIVAQEKSVFNFREIMDNKKILLVNLSKGRLGEINSSLLGLVIVGKILMSALSRTDAMGQKLNDFYLYIDEFQNVTTNSISQILSEARKYRLSLNIAHQYIGQLEEGIKNAVFGNVGSMAVFRVGPDDAKYLEAQLAPVFSSDDIIKLENRNAYLKLLVNGQPVKPFNIETLRPPEGRPEIIDKLKELSYLTYGRDRAEVEEEVARRYRAL